jgi:hypothetical protein
VLLPGDMLYIPRHHWHFVLAVDRAEAEDYYNNRSSMCSSACTNINTSSNTGEGVEFSFSVNFWWGKRLEKAE